DEGFHCHEVEYPADSMLGPVEMSKTIGLDPEKEALSRAYVMQDAKTGDLVFAARVFDTHLQSSTEASQYKMEDFVQFNLASLEDTEKEFLLGPALKMYFLPDPKREKLGRIGVALPGHKIELDPQGIHYQACPQLDGYFVEIRIKKEELAKR